MVLTPTYHVFNMYKHHQEATLLESSIETEMIGVDENYMVPNLNESVSLGQDGKIHVTLTNLSESQAYDIEGVFADTDIAEVKGTVLTEAMAAHNTFDNPDKVRPVDFTDVKVEGNKVQFKIPACSVLHLEISTK